MLILNLQDPNDCLKEYCLKFNCEPNIQKCMDGMITGQKKSNSDIAPSVHSKEEIMTRISNYQSEG